MPLAVNMCAACLRPGVGRYMRTHDAYLRGSGAPGWCINAPKLPRLAQPVRIRSRIFSNFEMSCCVCKLVAVKSQPIFLDVETIDMSQAISMQDLEADHRVQAGPTKAVVKLRHPWRTVSATVVALMLGGVLYSLLTNPNLGLEVIFEYLLSEPVIEGVKVTF